MLFLPNNFGASCFSQTIVIFQHRVVITTVYIVISV